MMFDRLVDDLCYKKSFNYNFRKTCLDYNLFCKHQLGLKCIARSKPLATKSKTDKYSNLSTSKSHEPNTIFIKEL